jgi:hypothetical protein
MALTNTISASSWCKKLMPELRMTAPRGARPQRQAKAGMSERSNMKLNQKVAWRHKGGFCIGVIVGAIYNGVTTYVVLVGDKLHETAQDDLLPSFA